MGTHGSLVMELRLQRNPQLLVARFSFFKVKPRPSPLPPPHNKMALTEDQVNMS